MAIIIDLSTKVEELYKLVNCLQYYINSYVITKSHILNKKLVQRSDIKLLHLFFK